MFLSLHGWCSKERVNTTLGVLSPRCWVCSWWGDMGTNLVAVTSSNTGAVGGLQEQSQMWSWKWMEPGQPKVF